MECEHECRCGIYFTLKHGWRDEECCDGGPYHICCDDTSTNYPRRILFSARKNSGDGCLDYLVQAIGIDARDDNGRTALHLSVVENYRRGFETMKLLEYGANVNAEDREGNTPLLLICNIMLDDVRNHITPCFDICLDLLRKEADFNLRNRNGDSPLSVLREAATYQGSDKERLSDLLEEIEEIESDCLTEADKEPDCS